MKNQFLIQLVFFLFSCTCLAQNVKPEQEIQVFTTVKGSKSSPRTILFFNYSEQNCLIKNTWIAQDENSVFEIAESVNNQSVSRGNSFTLEIIFTPSANHIGIFTADLMVSSSLSDSPTQVKLKGLSVRGMEGKNEPALSTILELFDYEIAIGWDSLANHTNPQLQGDEIEASVFTRADQTKQIEMLPIARFSPDFKLPFGYYKPTEKTMPKLYQVGELDAAGDHHQHQTTYPKVVTGNTVFEPVINEFGLFTYSPSHIAFTEDFLNQKFYPLHVAHATRVYPLKNKNGKQIENQYLICFEEAKNGDYQDYVFILKNVKVIR
jgi:hypothetical protein